MRANGIPNYPDPTRIDGSIDHNFNPDLNINPSSPAFLQARTSADMDSRARWTRLIPGQS